MSYIIGIIAFLLLFSVLILVHECGHFYAARKFGVKIEEFGMGIPPRAKKLWKDKKGTLFTLNWIPFGGFVRMFGEDSMDSKLRYADGSFASKSILARTLIILGGVIMNFFMGFILLTILFTVGVKPFVVTMEDFEMYRSQGVISAVDRIILSGFSDTSRADDIGLQKNDFILKANDREITSAQDLVKLSELNPGAELTLLIKRAEETLEFHVPVNDQGKMGIIVSQAPEIVSIEDVRYPFHIAIVEAAYQTGRLSVLTMRMFVNVLVDLFYKGQLSDQVSGPVGIARLTYQATQQGGLVEIFKLLALLSISLGAINVLPIPALDGGRFFSLFFEFITRRRPSAVWEARIHAFGFVLLIGLLFAVTYKDIVKLIHG